MDESNDHYAIVQIAFGPLPPGTTWDHPELQAATDRLANLFAEFRAPGPDADVMLSGKIQAVANAEHLNWAETDDLTWNEERAWTALGHYHSTYCLHGKHEQCRKGCKHCDSPCNCLCHPKQT